jgi:UDP-GlcNAc3NAcA epimerase
VRVTSIVGARPQFIKSWLITRALEIAGHTEVLVHTGQHYDADMSAVFFSELGLRPPDVSLGVGSLAHGSQTARMLEGIESVLLEDRPDYVIVYGDTNSTLAGALAAAKLGIRIAHVEAGLRSFDRSMPEEINRILTDHCAEILFCPTDAAIANLYREGITNGVYKTGDVMQDALAEAVSIGPGPGGLLAQLLVEPGEYYLATIHRPSNTDVPARLSDVVKALCALDLPVVWPAHPRVRARLSHDDLATIRAANVCLTPPQSYLGMIRLQRSAKAIITDSGGVQREAFWLGRPCVVLLDTTEWPETISANGNALCGGNPASLKDILNSSLHQPRIPAELHYGGVAERCVHILATNLA